MQPDHYKSYSCISWLLQGEVFDQYILQGSRFDTSEESSWKMLP